MSEPTPDLAGFAQAQDRLRKHFGEVCWFIREASVTFPPSTPIDPQTKRPYDPLIKPSASAQASGAVKCNVAFRPTVGADAETQMTPIGWAEETDILLIAPSAAASAASGAQEVLVRDERYKVVAMKPDGIGSKQRLLAWGKRR